MNLILEFGHVELSREPCRVLGKQDLMFRTTSLILSMPENLYLNAFHPELQKGTNLRALPMYILNIHLKYLYFSS